MTDVPMDNDQLLVACKIGLGFEVEDADLDKRIKQKMLQVKMFMKKAGVSEENITSDLGIGTLVIGINDLWDLSSGDIKFSPAFLTLTTQLA